MAQKTRIEIQQKGPRIALKKNLVFRVAEAFSKETGLQFHAKFKLEKRVPTGAGLGGGSSDAAAALRLLQRASFKIWKKKISDSVLKKIAAQYGSDISFFLTGSAAWCTGKGDTCQPIELASRDYVLVLPKTKVPTGWAYAQLDRARSGQKISLFPKEFYLAPSQIPFLENDFEVPILKLKSALRKMPILLAESGASAARMSGSGSAFFGVFPDSKSAARAAAQLKRRGLRTLAVRSLQKTQL